MPDLPASWPVQPNRIVPRDAERPTQVELTATVMTLLSPFFQPEEADEIYEAQIEAWKMALSDLPREAIKAAVRERLCQFDRRRPIPGEIRALALKFTQSIAPRLVLVDPYEPDPEFVPVTAERAREIMAEVGESRAGKRVLAGIVKAEEDQ